MDIFARQETEEVKGLKNGLEIKLHLIHLVCSVPDDDTIGGMFNPYLSQLLTRSS